ncbi:rod shape-determining protein MreD [Paracoccus sediminicola]|uniref:rod shape-determining protein MreD n=1 Tax=Paracoccus sediminicola TaxID=3017783 RepID=UPI0022F0E6A6|nr:rod shape-determining protein MreD [Paracoccus sediminicola]WBU55536.1 rod shape-determining protein MreD [Paracoccus sediminicola]
MSAAIRRRKFVGISVYIGLGLAFLFFRLMPLSPGDPGLPGPDLALCLTFAWLLRRPDQLPAIIIVALTLTGDFLLSRPFGLWSFVMLCGTEMLRPRSQRWSDQAFLFEWLRIALLMGLMMLGYRLMMMLVLLPVPGLGPVMLQWLATVAAYPVMVLFIHVIGVRRLSAAEIEMMVR